MEQENKRKSQHLQQVYQRKFSYGTVVQLCVARNKHRHSSKNCKGRAIVTTRRAWKDFTLKYNPDSDWKAALYKGLNWLQFTDGTNILNVNQDDASPAISYRSRHIGIPVVMLCMYTIIIKKGSKVILL